MVTATHAGVWTEADLADQPEDGVRRELLEGTLIVNAFPAGKHQNASFRLTQTLRNASPPSLLAVEALGLRVAGGSLLIPDIVVADRAALLAAESGVLDPDVVVLVVEIVSPSSRIMDRLTKPDLYASAGIGAFWRVELDDDPAVHTHLLIDGTYTTSGVARPGHPLQVDVPFPVTVEAADLL